MRDRKQSNPTQTLPAIDGNGDGFEQPVSHNDVSLGDQAAGTVDLLLERLDTLSERLTKIEAVLGLLVRQGNTKDWYSTAEVAQILGKAEFTIREWCRQRRVRAAKRPCGRGRAKEWAISHAELLRIQNEGLLPLPKN